MYEQPMSGGTSGLPDLPRAPEDVPGVYERFAELRAEQPVLLDARMGMPTWHVLRYEDVSTVLTDHSRFSSSAFSDGSFLSDTLLVKDPPDHRKLRSLVNIAFTPRSVAGLADRVAKIAQELLDRVRAKGEMDIVADLAFPLPARVIAEMLGVPDEDWDIFQRWARVTGSEPGAPAMRGEMDSYFSGLLEARRRDPREDLITALSTAEVDGERLSERELTSFCTLLLIAGQETTKNLIANFVLTMSDHPDDLATLVAHPEAAPAAAEEVLRYLPPVWFVVRSTTTDVTLGGVEIPAGQLLMPWMASANRDERAFPDPDRFDIRREPNRHLTFGHGVHFCVGAPLTRMEAKVVLPMLLEQLEDLRVRRERPIRINAGLVFVIENLPVTFRAS
jgi:cytochrome P450